MFRVLGWRKQKFCMLTLFFAFVFIWGLLTTPELQSYNQHLLQNQIEFKNVKAMFEIEPLLGKNKRYNVTHNTHLTEIIRPRLTISSEKSLFRSEKMGIIEQMLQQNYLEWNDVHCSGNLYNYKGSFVLLHNVVIDPSKKRSKARGGEDIQLVIGHTERDEEVIVLDGFFSLPCETVPKITFPKHSHFTNWILGITNGTKEWDTQKLENSSFTVLVKRGDYANLYWTLIELYNTYLTIRLFNEDPKTTKVIIMDAHPLGKLDNLWRRIFGKVQRIGEISYKTFHQKLAWVIPDGPMPKNVKAAPYVEGFKSEIYKGLMTSSSLYHDCSSKSDMQNVTFILRKNYVAHPRNPRGNVQRKLSNEKELIDYLRRNIPEARINAIQIDLLTIEDQVRLIYETNVLIGVHGAGLGHTLLLRAGSTMIELFPSSYKRSPNPHFQQFAFWADVHYDRWYSTAPAQRNNEWVYVEPEPVYKLIKHALGKSCRQ